MTALDFAILLPALPLIPIAITWWLPWENWIPWGKLPLQYLGPYLLYVAFVAWHFELHTSLVLIAAAAGLALIAWSFFVYQSCNKNNEL